MKQLLRGIFLTAISCAVTGAAGESAVPDGYRLLYHQTFSSPEALDDFEFSDAAAWRYGLKDGKGALELFGKSDYQPRVRSPFNIALIKEPAFGDFVLEAEFIQTGREYGHRDMCIFFGAKEASNFYYVHVATKADPHAHNIFLVNDEPRVAIAEKTTEGADWGLDVWHTIRIERKINDGTINVFFDDMNEPIMRANDTHFDFGRIGFGSFDDTGMVRNIRIWGPEPAAAKDGFFE